MDISAAATSRIETATASALAVFRRPVDVIVVEELPRNPMGKVQTALLRTRFGDLFARP